MNCLAMHVIFQSEKVSLIHMYQPAEEKQDHVSYSKTAIEMQI